MTKTEEAAWIEEWYTPIYRLALQRLGHEADALDAAQEACILLLRDRASLRDPARLRSWVYRVAHNVIRKQLRGSIARRQREARVAVPESREATADPAEQRERHALLRRSVAGLPEATQSVIVLRYFHGLSAGEIGAALDVPRTTVQYRINKGLASLRSRLGAGAAAITPKLEAELGQLLWPLAPPKLKASVLSVLGAAGLVTGAALIKAKLTLVFGLSALSFTLGLASRDRSRPERAPPPAEAVAVDPLKAERERLAAAIERIRAENGRLRTGLNRRARSKSPASFALPAGWQRLETPALRALLARIFEAGPAGLTAIEAMLADGHERVFQDRARLARIDRPLAAPSLRFALISRLGQLDSGRLLDRIKAEPGLIDCAALVLALAGESGDRGTLFTEAFGGALRREREALAEYDRAREFFLAGLSEDLRAELLNPKLEADPELKRRAARELAAWEAEHPSPSTRDRLIDYEHIGAALDIPALLPELRLRIRSGGADVLGLIALLPESQALEELAELWRALRGEPSVAAYEVLVALAGLPTADKYPLLLHEAAGMSRDRRKLLVSGVVSPLSRMPYGEDQERREGDRDRAAAGVRFLESLAPLCADDPELSEDIQDWIRRLRGRFDLR